MRVMLCLLLAIAGVARAQVEGFVVKPVMTETSYLMFQNAETWKSSLEIMEKAGEKNGAAKIRALIAHGGYVTVFFRKGTDYAQKPENFTVTVSDAKGKELVKMTGKLVEEGPDKEQSKVSMDLVLQEEPVFPLKVTVRDSRKTEPEVFEISPKK